MPSWTDNMTSAVRSVSPNGSAPHCEHADGLLRPPPQSASCSRCQVFGATWRALVVCLTCGWVACSNESTHHHARAHYEETDHPVAGSLIPGSAWRWCFVHQREV